MCELCNPKRITKWYDNVKSKYWLVFDCKTCNMPMVVLKRHSMQASIEEIEEAVYITAKYFPHRTFRINQRNIKDHLHWHLISQA